MTFPLSPSESSGLVTALDAALFGFALLVSLALLAWIGWRRRPMGWMFAAALVPQVAANALLAILLPCLALGELIASGFAGEAIALLLLGPGGLLSAALAGEVRAAGPTSSPACSPLPSPSALLAEP